jgi:opacity protein-like surface antigen
MRIVKSFLLGAAMLACIPAVAGAQDRMMHFYFGGGPTFISGNMADHFGTGVGPAVGATFDLSSRISFGAEYAFRRFHADNWVDILGGSFTAYHDTHQIAFNMIFNVTPADSRARVYIVAGPGAYYRKVTVTKYEGTGIVCDPYWYICGTYPIESILGSRGGWDFGFNVGAGVGFKLGSSDDAEFTIESRYHFVQGPEITPTPAQAALGFTGGKANGYYIPLTFGFRF